MRKFQTGWAQGLAPPLMAAVAVRLLLWVVALARTGTGVIAGGDSASYLEPGLNLLLRGRFSTGGLPEIGRTPGYALFVAATSGWGPAIAALVQVALSVVCVYLGWRLAKTVFGDCRIATCAGWLMAFEPVSIVYSVRLLSETLFVAVLLLSLERLVFFLQSRSLRALAWGGVWLAVAAFVRPVAYYLAFAGALWVLVACWRDHALRWKAPALLLAVTLPWLAAWQGRNYAETGFAGFSSIQVRNLYFYNAASVSARTEGREFVQVQRSFGYPDEASYSAAHPEQKGWSEAQRLIFMKGEARRILTAHWTWALRDQVTGSAVVLLTPCAADLLELVGLDGGRAPARVVSTGILAGAARIANGNRVRVISMVLLELWLVTLYCAAARGVLRGGAKPSVLVLLIVTCMYFAVVSGGVAAVGRYRISIMPVVCVLAAAGVSNTGSRKEEPPGIPASS
jgi:hypothetical protein